MASSSVIVGVCPSIPWGISGSNSLVIKESGGEKYDGESASYHLLTGSVSEVLSESESVR
jgi:hypothetical protein